MKLTLVKQGEFLGTNCDFYLDESRNIFMSRTQVGYALQYKDPANAVKNIHNKYHDRFDKFSIEIAGAQFEPPLRFNKNAEKVYMYEERGVYEVCRRSRQPVADNFHDWIYETIQSIKQNGYYIATEQDSKWLGIRQETKAVRKMETDQIKLFVEYAKAQGIQNADRYYILITKLINQRVGIGTGERDKADQKTLLRLKSLETVVELHLATLMGEGVSYKGVYQGVRKFIEAL